MSRCPAARAGLALAALALAGCAVPAAHVSRPAAHLSRPAAQLSRPAAQPQPPAKRAVLLTGVSCTAARACTAVGSFYTSAAGPSLTLAERWNGRSWQAQPTASRGRDSRLAGVSCAAADACVAVGSPAQAWAGGRWRPAAGGRLASVSCVSATWCQAVGNGPSAAGWNGRRWQPEPVPGPAHRVAALASVSCVSVSFCLAVGDAQRPPGARPGGTDRALAELWDGARWRVIRRPVDPARHTALAGVSCVSARFCLAVGATDAQYTLAERWTGVRWQVEPTPDVNRIGYTVLDAVSCTSPSACVAVGSYNVGIALVAEQWNGHRWRLTRLPGGPNVGPPSVSCTPAGCLVVASGPDRPRWLRLRA